MVFCYVAAQLHLKMTLLHVSVAYGVNEHRDVQGSKFMVFQLSALLAFFNAPPQFNHHMSFLFIFMLKLYQKASSVAWFMINATTNMNLLVDVGPFFIAKSWRRRRRGGGMLDEICGFILWFEALMNRKVMLVADLEKTKFANVYILVI